MSFRIFKSGKAAELIQEEKTRLTELAGIEARINNRTRELQDAAAQLRGLSDASKDIEADGEERPTPHGPSIDLPVLPEDAILDAKTTVNRIMDNSQGKREIRVVAVSSQKPGKA